MSVRLTVTLARVKGQPHQPDTMVKGGRVTEVHPDWPSALDRLDELAATGRVNQATITPLEIADRNYETAKGRPQL